MLRAAIRNKTELGKISVRPISNLSDNPMFWTNCIGLKAKSVIERGELVSDELVIGLIMNNVKRPSCINGIYSALSPN
jgi:adenylate kinase family enzyme